MPPAGKDTSNSKTKGFKGEVEEVLRLVAGERERWEKVLAQKAMGTSGEG